MKKVLVFMLLLFAVLFGIIGCQGKNSFSIGIIQIVEHQALDASRDGFIDALKDAGYQDGKNITLDIQNAQGDPNNLSTISDRFVSNKVDLVLAIATPSAEAIAGKTSQIPILGTAVTDYVAAKLVDSNQAPGGNVSGTTDLNPVKEQIELILKLVPDAKTIGVMYNSSEINSEVQAAIAKDTIETLGLKYVETTITSSNDVQQAAQSLVGKCDAIYLPTDNIIASSMPLIHSVTVASKTPVICGEEGMVKGGGLATIGIDYYNLGYTTGKMAVKLIKGEAKIASMPIESASEFNFAINETVALEIGLTIPDDMKQYIIE